MPYLDIRLASPFFEEATCRQLALTGTRLANELLGKRPGVTAVSINHFPMWAWMSGRSVQLERNAPAAYAELTITSGTNSSEEKAAFVAAMSAALKTTLPGLSEASYVVIREVDAENWGYDGVTQYARRQQRTVPAEGIRRTPSGALDMAYYEKRARQLRGEALVSWVMSGCRRLARAWGKRPPGREPTAAGL